MGRKSLQIDFWERAAGAYRKDLDHVMDYLKARGIDREVADMFHLGFVTDPIPGHEQYEGRLFIPYRTPAGIRTAKFRCIEDHDCKQAECVKYLAPPKSNHLFNVMALHERTDVMVITEGELDAVIIGGVLGVPAVGCPGVNNWQPHYSRLFQDYTEVVVATDGDDPGRKFGRFVIDQIDNARVAPMPPDHDVNSFFLENGEDALLSRLGIL